MVSVLSGCGEGFSQEPPQSYGGAGMKPRPPVGPGKSPALIPSCWGDTELHPPLSTSSLSTPPEVFLEGAGWRTRGREQHLGCQRQRTLHMRPRPAEGPFCRKRFRARQHSPAPSPGTPSPDPWGRARA